MIDRPKGRILSLDIGDVRIGVAISDPLGIIANTLGFISGESKKEKINKIKEIIKMKSPVLIVAGLPLNMDGSRGKASLKIKKFVKLLRKEIDIPVEMVDERLTTSEAQKLLISADVSRSKRKNVVDGMAASLILQKYLEMN